MDVISRGVIRSVFVANDLEFRVRHRKRDIVLKRKLARFFIENEKDRVVLFVSEKIEDLSVHAFHKITLDNTAEACVARLGYSPAFGIEKVCVLVCGITIFANPTLLHDPYSRDV